MDVPLQVVVESSLPGDDPTANSCAPGQRFGDKIVSVE
jgi:hypothetical protein